MDLHRTVGGMVSQMGGPLAGLTVVELAGIGPAPFCGMVLADYGAEVIRVERHPAGPSVLGTNPKRDLLNRNKKSIALDLKVPEGREAVGRLIRNCEILIEGYRPGVAERLGVGPEDALEVNPALVYGRMTGWGQEGPYAGMAGHDINYIGISGVLHAIGTEDEPQIPLNMIADFGGGGMLLVAGLLAALLEARATGLGQVVDAAMVDGAALLSTMVHSLKSEGRWLDQRRTNFLDGGAPFYSVYQTSDHRHMAVGALEPQFFAELVRLLDVEESCPAQTDVPSWPEMRRLFAERFRTRSQAEWTALFIGTDACVTPVWSLSEALADSHLASRETFIAVDSVAQPAPAPRFSRTPAAVPDSPVEPGADADDLLVSLGYSPEEIGKLRSNGVVG